MTGGGKRWGMTSNYRGDYPRDVHLHLTPQMGKWGVYPNPPPFIGFCQNTII